MKRFRLNFGLLLAAVIALTACGVMLFERGLWAQGTLTMIGVAVCAAALARLVGKLIGVMSTFVSALEMNDTTMSFDFGRDDAAISLMTDAMNRIVSLYHTNLREIETGKLYYDRILRIMSHEMRNSVAPIIALTADMEKHPAKYRDDELREALGMIGEQSRGIKRFLDAYWTLTHLPEPQTRSTDAAEFFGRVRRLVAIEARERGLEENVCSFAVGKDMKLEIDHSLMTQAMINLLRNALDAVKDSDSPRVDVTATLAGGHPYIVVSDNGSGIAPDIRENLFQPFVTTKTDGSGVGLCLSRQIVRQHGGDLRLLAGAGRGAAFAITLP